MRKQVELWKVVVVAGLMLMAYLAGVGAGDRGGSQAIASPALGFPDSGAQFNQMIRSLDSIQTSLKMSGGQLQEISELLKSGKLQVMVKEGRPGVEGSDARSGGAVEIQQSPRAPAQRPPLSRLVEQ